MATKPTAAELKAFDNDYLLYLLIEDKAWGECYRREIRTRARAVIRDRSDSNNIWAKIYNATNRPSESRQQTEEAPATISYNSHWLTDGALIHEPEFFEALKLFHVYANRYWTKANNKGETLSKEPVEVEDFLTSIIDTKTPFAELPEKKQNMLGMIRRLHSQWARKAFENAQSRNQPVEAV